MLKILETINFLSIIAMLFSLPIVFAMPVVYGVYYVITRRKSEWRKNVFAWPDLLSPLVVGVVWMMVEAVKNVKSLSNLAIEPFMIGVIWCAAWIFAGKLRQEQSVVDNVGAHWPDDAYRDILCPMLARMTMK